MQELSHQSYSHQNTQLQEYETQRMIISAADQSHTEKFSYQMNEVDTSLKKFKIKKSDPKNSKKLKIRYPSQDIYIGNVRCWFFSFYKYGRSPMLSIGPSWPFTIGLLIFAFVALAYFLWMLSLLKIIDPMIQTTAIIVMFTNIGVLLTGIL